MFYAPPGVVSYPPPPGQAFQEPGGPPPPPGFNEHKQRKSEEGPLKVITRQ